MLKELQRNAAFMDPTRAAAHLVGSQGDAMKMAAGNHGAGPAMAFMGMNMAGQAGGMNAQNLFADGPAADRPSSRRSPPCRCPPDGPAPAATAATPASSAPSAASPSPRPPASGTAPAAR